MPYDQDRWIAALPLATEEETEHLSFDGWLLVAEKDEVRIVTGLLCLTFVAGDVVSIEELERTRRLARVRVLVRRGAALRDAVPKECVVSELPAGRRPFVLACRPFDVRSYSRPRYRSLEQEFLQQLVSSSETP